MFFFLAISNIPGRSSHDDYDDDNDNGKDNNDKHNYNKDNRNNDNHNKDNHNKDNHILSVFLVGGGAQPSATCILNIALPTRDGCDKF